ncbi:PKD domain-containing protein [Paraflavitalea soli]|uniref:PKD domain-containing protein n=1 Tax=Paraflavitalea soli TaxID=2315862 RepID=A0A3B7MJQ6_9BACT|nr:PKD domain-containing protein [Paraflavitalea soli]AXY73479.1 PKD domain-containing protein [Paraflavitalea soli]
MNASRHLLPVLVLLLVTQWAAAQINDTLPAVVEPQVDNNRVKFTSQLRPLRGVAGAPAPFYTYFWEFGDGTYSFEKEPVHLYKDTGDYPVRLWATNNYDDGKKPPTRLKKIKVEKKTMLAANTPPAFFKGGGSLEMITNQMPRPGEDMVLLLGYRNKPGSHTATVSGSVMLLYNEKQFGQNSFDLAEARSYHQEKKIGLDSLLAYAPAEEWNMPLQGTLTGEADSRGGGLFTASGGGNLPIAGKPQLKAFLKEQMEGYRQHHIWRINEVKQGEEQFMFLSLNTLPEMIKDTNAVVTISGLFIPDDPSMDVERFALDLQIVASHDPNRIMLKNRRLNYRFTGKNRENIYKVQFQNTGKGPAKRVAITVTIPGMLNTGTVELVDMKPACTWCDSAYANQSCIDTILTKDSIQFIFKNIYLPGTQQEGISDPDSTMGYVRYKLRFTKKMKKMPFTSRASIVFDKNEPIYTNRSVGRFKKGLSPGIIIGYNTIPGKKPQDILPQNYVLGFTLSEYAAYKKYFQWEIYLEKSRSYESYDGRRIGGDTMINGVGYKVEYRDQYRQQKVLSLEAVPVHFRYNINSYMAAGAGALVGVDVERSVTPVVETWIQRPNGQGLALMKGAYEKQLESFANWRGAFFADFQLGIVRAGPAAGIRFLQYINPSHQRIFLYASWKL